MTAPQISTWFRATPVDEEPEGWDEALGYDVDEDEDEQPITERDVPAWDLP